jgi:hypothetical protein
MRDLLNLIDNVLTEAALAAAEIPAKKMSAVKNPTTGQLMTRQELFLWKVINSSPFTALEKAGGGEVTINPAEAPNVRSWLSQGMTKPIVLTTTDGDTIKNNELLKTVEFGSKEAEGIKIKGSDVFGSEDTDVKDMGNSIESIMAAGGFPAMDMYDAIAKSPQIKTLGKVGQAVVAMAKQITQGVVPTIPAGLSAQEIKAIELYASEYLGVLGLVAGIVPFKQGNRQDFDNFIGTDLGSMIIYFPKNVSNPLADSFSVTNDQTGHSIKISSKAAGKGAPPSLTSLKLPNDLRDKYPEAAEFLDTAQDTGISTFAQPFKMLNAMYEINPDNVPVQYSPLLPFSDELIAQLETTVKSNKPVPKNIMSVFNKRLTDKVEKSDNSDGGKAWYAVTTDIINAVNKGSAVPNLREALIESLGYNFVQLYTNVKGGKLVTEAFWPAKLKGEVKLKTKGSASDPKKGKLSVEISPGKEKANIEVGSSKKASVGKNNFDSDKETADLDAVTQTPRLRGPGARTAKSGAQPNMSPEVLGRRAKI